MVHGERTTVRRASDADADLLVAWHADPDVSRYWDDETFTREQVLERLRREPVDSWIVEAEGEPVGFLQSWWETGVGSPEPAESAGAGFAGAGAGRAAPRRGGLDMFLVPSARGRGLGPDAARALATHLLRDAGWARVTVDPYAWNERAIAGWRKAGFREVSRHPADEEHVAEWVLMVFEPLG